MTQREIVCVQPDSGYRFGPEPDKGYCLLRPPRSGSA